MSDDPTTARAQRRQAVASGAEPDAVDRVTDRYDPRGSAAETTPRRRQQTTASDVAAEIDVEREGVGTIDRLGGLDVFLRGPGPSQFGANVRQQFAGAADFVAPDDVAPNVDADAISADPSVPSDRRDDVAQRAREQTAADAEFIRASDLDADVSGRGVTDLGVAPDRQDDVEQRAEAGLASEDPFAEPGDFAADVSRQGIESAGLTDPGARRRAGRQFESETPLGEVDPSDDVTETDDGFGLTGDAQQRIAARQFEDEFDAFGQGELDTGDVRDTDSGFGLARGPAREVAAARLDAQTDESVTPGDIELERGADGGFEAIFEQEVSR